MLDNKFVKKQVNLAASLVENIEELYKIPTFQAIFSRLLDSKDVSEGKMASKTPSGMQNVQNTNKRIEGKNGNQLLAKKYNIALKSLNDVVDFKNDTVLVISELPMSVIQAQITVAKICLLYHQIVFDKDWVSTSDVARSIKKLNISKKHLSRNILKDKTIRKTGSTRSTEYKLNNNGIQSTIELIQTLASGGTK